jgi:hemerythrin-like domain-containing protein
MSPTIDLRGEHSAMKIILSSMNNLANELQASVKPDLFRMSQITDFLSIYILNCHYEKEEKGIFAALLELDKPYLTKTINRLVSEHTIARSYVKDLVLNLHKFINGQYVSLLNISKNFSDFVALEEQHMRTEDTVILPYSERLISESRMWNIASEIKIIQDQQVGSEKHYEYYKLLNKLHSENK